jgi:hypothetical protein
VFSRGARDEAERRAEVLTAGPEAADAFETIEPLPSDLELQVLLDADGVPRAVVGTVRFSARGTGADAVVMLRSDGRFIFGKSNGDWTVVSFSVSRSDKEKELPPSASPSSEPSAAPSHGPAEGEPS